MSQPVYDIDLTKLSFNIRGEVYLGKVLTAEAC